MTSRRAAFALAALLLLLSAGSLFVGLGRLPALTADESWVGIFAFELRRAGLFVPHEMNTYTGPLYGLILSKMIGVGGGSVLSLRLFGACANAAAFLILAEALRRKASAEAAAWWALLLSGSAYVLLKSRLAWDVYALQPLMMAITIALLDEPVTGPRALLFCAATLVGVQNHFIYLSIPLSLCVLYGARAAWRGEEDARPMFRLAVSALAMGAVVFVVKPRLTRAAWLADRYWALPLFFALSPTAAAAACAQPWDDALIALLRHAAVRRWAGRALAIGAAAFAIWHGPPLWQALAGPVVWRRTFSWDAPWAMTLPLDLWALFLIGAVVWRAVRAWHGREAMSAHERTLALWPAAYAAVFILFRNTSSLRYYALIQLISLASLAAALPRLPRPDRRWALALAVYGVVAAQGALWRELAFPTERKPFSFKIGWHTENSWDFASKDALFAAFDASRACKVAHLERSFVAIPVQFHQMAAGDVPCNRDAAFDADVCKDCAAPPFYRWTTVTSPKNPGLRRAEAATLPRPRPAAPPRAR